MTFFIPLWVLVLCGFVFGVIYFIIGWIHFTFDAGTSYQPGRLRYLFFWPYEWLKLLVGFTWEIIRNRRR